jgi:uncharacterized membrane protein
MEEIINMDTTHTSTGIGFCGLLEIVFITLKLVGVIGWSWVWVLAPVWIPVAIALVVTVVFICITVGRLRNKKRTH